MASNYLENYDPAVLQNGIITNKPAVFGSTVATGSQTITGTMAVSGATTLSGAVTQKANVISGQGATATLTAAQSGSVVLFDRAAGIVFTLPAPAVGIYFDFIVTTTITSNNAEVDTDSGSTFLLGNVNSQIDATATDKAFFGNGSSHVKVQMNGTTTGGIKGTQLRFTAVSSTVWNVTGMLAASGALATPFA